jgi:DNA-binding Lrp family transcriptional regulator
LSLPNGVDPKDSAILDLLRENSRTTYQELSNRLRESGVEISTVGVLKRVQRLKERGIITNFTVRVDYEKIGLTTPILILMRLKPKPIKEFAKDIQCQELQDSRVLSIFTLASQFNVGLLGIWESRQAFGRWKTRLLMRLDSVLEMQELFLLDAYKWERDGEVKIPAHIKQEIDELGRK